MTKKVNWILVDNVNTCQYLLETEHVTGVSIVSEMSSRGMDIVYDLMIDHNIRGLKLFDHPKSDWHRLFDLILSNELQLDVLEMRNVCFNKELVSKFVEVIERFPKMSYKLFDPYFAISNIRILFSIEPGTYLDSMATLELINTQSEKYHMDINTVDVKENSIGFMGNLNVFDMVYEMESLERMELGISTDKIKNTQNMFMNVKKIYQHQSGKFWDKTRMVKAAR